MSSVEQNPSALAPPDARSGPLGPGRKTVGVLVDCIDHLTRGYEFELREAFDASCRALDVNLLMICGRPLEHPDPWTAAHNAAYEMAGPASVDGVILFTPGLASHGGISAIRRLADRYRELPICSLGLPRRTS